MRPLFSAFFPFIVCGLLASLVFGDDVWPTGRLSRDDRARLAPGVRLTVRPLNSDKSAVDVRTTRLFALAVNKGAPPTAFLPPGAFQAEFRSLLRVRLGTEVAFSLVGVGRARLDVNGETLLDTTSAAGTDLANVPPVVASLKKGDNDIRLTWTSLDEGEGFVRLLWSGDGFATEPLPPPLLAHFPDEQPLATGTALRLGRQLLTTHKCLACHAGGPDGHVDGMPELATTAPSLVNITRRRNTAWLAEYLRDPHAIRNDVLMPHMLGHLPGESRSEAVADLVAYLETFRSDEPTPDATAEVSGDRSRGELLFETRGCIGCHAFEEDESDRVRLSHVGHKFPAGEIAAYLSDPRKHYASNRMPDLKLKTEETQDLEIYLRSRRDDSEAAAVAEGEIERGRGLYGSLGCANCHAEPKSDVVTLSAPALFSGAAGGCLSDEPAPPEGGRAHYRFTDDEKHALRTFLSGSERSRRSLARSVPAEYTTRQVEHLRCNVCHTLDGQKSSLPEIMAEEGETGLLPGPVPLLTYAGEKLRTEWMSDFIGGRVPYRVREHFRLRMPKYGHESQSLALGFAQQHGIPAGPDDRSGVLSTTRASWDPDPQPDPEMASVGKQITLAEGFACNRCHAVGAVPPSAPFESRSTNLAYARDRLRFPYFERWMLDPQRFDKETRMLKFSPDGKTTQLPQHYGGDARRQFTAIWHYLKVLDDERTEADTSNAE